VPGHWEGDPIIGLDRSAIGTLVERTPRFTMLLHLPPMPGRGVRAAPRLRREGPRVKNGPAPAGRGAGAVRVRAAPRLRREAIATAIMTLPEQLRRSLTRDQGAEMAKHADLRVATGLEVYFCDPRSPWQRGSNENANGLPRRYFPKDTDLGVHGADDLAAVAGALNGRPRKTLGWRTPAEALDRLLEASHAEAVATAGRDQAILVHQVLGTTS
jgi:IS30 family transposase